MADMAVVRYALRGVIVAGVAGAAWLLWTAGADAASTVGPEGSDLTGGVIGAVLGVDGAARQAATARPVGSLGPHGAGAAPITSLVPLPAAVARMVRAVEPAVARPDVPASGRAVVPAHGRAVVPAHGRAVVPAHGRAALSVARAVGPAGLVEPVNRVVEPVTELVQPVARLVEPVSRVAASHGGLKPRPVTGGRKADRVAVRTIGRPYTSRLSTVGFSAVGFSTVGFSTLDRSTVDGAWAGATDSTAEPLDAGRTAGSAIDAAPASRTHHQPRPATGRGGTSPVGDRAGPDGTTGMPHPPAPAPAPLPLPAYPGLTGTPTTASGSTSDGGATAVLLYRFAAGAVARHRPVPAADVAARPLTALVPTVSPD